MQPALLEGIKNLFPGYFALVMATGIVSKASFFLGMEQVAWSLFHLNKAAYGILWLLTLLRLFRYRPHLVADLQDFLRGPGFLTVVAGTAVLGSQFVILTGDVRTGFYLWLLASSLWCLLIYTFFAAVTVRGAKPALENGVNGAWLMVVSTQSLSVRERWPQVIFRPGRKACFSCR